MLPRYDNVSPEELAQKFHEWYELLAPSLGYKTREASAVAWNSVPDDNKRLMISTALHVIESLDLCKIRHATNGN